VNCRRCLDTGYQSNYEICGCVDEWVSQHIECGDFGDLYGHMPAPFRFGLEDKFNQQLPEQAYYNRRRDVIEIKNIGSFRPADESMPFWEATAIVSGIIRTYEEQRTIPATA